MQNDSSKCDLLSFNYFRNYYLVYLAVEYSFITVDYFLLFITVDYFRYYYLVCLTVEYISITVDYYVQFSVLIQLLAIICRSAVRLQTIPTPSDYFLIITVRVLGSATCK